MVLQRNLLNPFGLIAIHEKNIFYRYLEFYMKDKYSGAERLYYFSELRFPLLLPALPRTSGRNSLKVMCCCIAAMMCLVSCGILPELSSTLSFSLSSSVFLLKMGKLSSTLSYPLFFTLYLCRFQYPSKSLSII